MKADILDRGIFFRLKGIGDEDRKYLGKSSITIRTNEAPITWLHLGYFGQGFEVRRLTEKPDVSKIPRMADWGGER